MNHSVQAADQNTKDTPVRWFLRGTAVGLLLMGSVNAISYFFRSEDWGSLVGQSGKLRESVGFPFKVWEAGNTYGGMFADYPRMGLNLLVALGVGAVLGSIAVRHSGTLNRFMEAMESESLGHAGQPIQFTLRGLLITTLMVAVTATLARNFAARPETLIVIYTLGPLALVAVAMLPRRITWQKRIMIIIPATGALIAAAIAVGNAMEMEFDKVLMGIFLCWTPQSALAAFALTAWLLYRVSSNESAKLAPTTASD